ncbi:anti-sigma factor [Nocardia cyriacigeorgica]|uniref:anti-sigma factor n=1 Tax=Nocardia cyriacigeorgica TaxID=135487 RepID=UPI002458EBDD|nr:anti-sigma factor [Nocardia cyriacigeorgica]
MHMKTGAASRTRVLASVRVPAAMENLMMLRALTETVALVGDYAVDQAADIRLAVDEVVTALVLDAVGDSMIDCAFYPHRPGMDVRVSAVLTVADAPDENSFGWHVLTTLTDQVSVERDGYDEAVGGYPVVVEFRCATGSVDVD